MRIRISDNQKNKISSLLNEQALASYMPMFVQSGYNQSKTLKELASKYGFEPDTVYEVPVSLDLMVMVGDKNLFPAGIAEPVQKTRGGYSFFKAGQAPAIEDGGTVKFYMKNQTKLPVRMSNHAIPMFIEACKSYRNSINRSNPDYKYVAFLCTLGNNPVKSMVINMGDVKSFAQNVWKDILNGVESRSFESSPKSIATLVSKLNANMDVSVLDDTKLNKLKFSGANFSGTPNFTKIGKIVEQLVNVCKKHIRVPDEFSGLNQHFIDNYNEYVGTCLNNAFLSGQGDYGKAATHFKNIFAKNK